MRDDGDNSPGSEEGFRTIEMAFRSGRRECAGILYRGGEDATPVVVMAHGFGASMNMGLHEYAVRFAAKGLSVFMFDYRGFGKSGGEPRQVVSPSRHLQDWHNAVEFVKALEGIDRDRIALWGTSFSGGHAIVTASRHREIRAVVAQVPFADGLDAALHTAPGKLLHGTVAAIRDLLASALTGRPRYVPIVAPQDRFGVLNAADSYEGFFSLLPEGFDFQNFCAGRIFFTLPLYRPMRHAGRVSCPVLVIIAERDSLIRPRSAHRMASRFPEAEVMPLDALHFQVYSGEFLERIMERQIGFLLANLGHPRT